MRKDRKTKGHRVVSPKGLRTKTLTKEIDRNARKVFGKNTWDAIKRAKARFAEKEEDEALSN